jgi:hypothetical protein
MRGDFALAASHRLPILRFAVLRRRTDGAPMQVPPAQGGKPTAMQLLHGPTANDRREGLDPRMIQIRPQRFDRSVGRIDARVQP